jgi:hypothetical protein
LSVALSSDGNTALIGGTQDNEDSNTGFAPGAAWVFTRSGSTWSQQGGKLTGGGETGGGFFGSSVALSSDGNTALIGGSADDRNVGAAWEFFEEVVAAFQEFAREREAGAVTADPFGELLVVGAIGAGGEPGALRGLI